MSLKAKPAKVRIAPSGSGGPGNFLGSEFQIDCATLKSLYLIHRHLYEPLKPSSITIEPRFVHQDKVTRWDIRTDPPLTATEAKANLSKDDLLDFLQRVGEATGFEGRFELVYGRSKASLLSSVMRLGRLAVECGADHQKFDDLARLEEIRGLQTILEALEPRFREALAQMAFEDLSEGRLKRELGFVSRCLFPDQPDRLVEFISKRFREGAISRQKYEIVELVDLIEVSGMTLARPATVKLTELSVPVRSALAILQAATSGLPGEVVAAAAETTTEQLQEMLSGLDLVSIDDGVWRIRPFPYQVPAEDRVNLLCRGLEGLFDFLRSHETDNRTEAQLRNAVSLSQECLRARPELALPLFQATEHIVKNLGDRHLLLEISNLCIDADRQSCSGVAEKRACAQARAQAMLCGTSWVFQRTWRLHDARYWANKSLQLGEDISWDRNTAFAKKCMGRLDRIEAEQPDVSVGDKASLVRESVAKLEEAIERFTHLGEFGPTNRQVGDCYSLLARTFLVARKRGDTEAALRKAYEILPADPGKMYFDLLILNGDFEVAWGSREHANDLYTEVIDHHLQNSREHSEIYARALFKRAANRAQLGRKQMAMRDYGQAAEVWRSLDEPEEQANAEWERHVLEGKIDGRTLDLFRVGGSPLDRLGALNIYLGHLGNTGALARRSSPTRAQVDDYLKQARQRHALDYPE